MAKVKGDIIYPLPPDEVFVQVYHQYGDPKNGVTTAVVQKGSLKLGEVDYTYRYKLVGPVKVEVK